MALSGGLILKQMSGGLTGKHLEALHICRWWDIRNFGKATREWLVARDETLTDPDKAEGVCSLSFEPTMSSKFMVGTAQGNVLSCRMQAKHGTSGLLLMLLLLILLLLLRMFRFDPWGV